MRNFNSARTVDAIRNLADMKGIKLGDIERAAGVTPGYLSRTRKAGILPPMEVLAVIADQLGVSIDFLVFRSADIIADTACDIALLADKLLSDTYHARLVWTRYPARLLTGRSDAEFKELPVQLFNTTADDDSGITIWDREFHSHFDKGATIAGDAFSAKLGKQNATIFLLAVQDTDGVVQRELYLESRSELDPICTTSALSTEVADLVRQLYETVDSDARIAGLGLGMNKALRQYLYGQKGE